MIKIKRIVEVKPTSTAVYNRNIHEPWVNVWVRLKDTFIIKIAKNRIIGGYIRSIINKMGECAQ